jgi:hypothetical protein
MKIQNIPNKNVKIDFFKFLILYIKSWRILNPIIDKVNIPFDLTNTVNVTIKVEVNIYKWFLTPN